ncbi:hypothetical protein [Nocardioides euryhalodurans]|uniref:Uncharacterized protein n=1 Tax=Nocardioides euryhalodurans TaxID=2518370 RepID=A0A4V1BDP4_9ACTN|nr:hypothetical protein [Nocardioides euryhalodurans]QBR91832.1 hypothetical protein EXE57_05745 [Nocardioides euryhalodurans]
MTTNLRDDDKVLLVKVDHSAALAADHDALYELARKWWKASATQVQPVRRVLAIVNNKVLAAYEPYRWEVATDPDLLGRVAFHGDVAPDADQWVDTDVSHLFPQGAANPVRYTTVAALKPAGGVPSPDRDDPMGQAVAPLAGEEPLILLLRINKSWHDGISDVDLYDVTRHWWVMSATKAEQVVRVLAVANGIVREAYLPVAWGPCPVPGEEHRIGFDGVVAEDRGRWVGADVSSIFPPGSQNPVRYVRAADLDMPTVGSLSGDRSIVVSSEDTSSPGLPELVNPLLKAFEADLMWAMSRGAQELFHSNTIAALLTEHPRAAAPLAGLFADDDAATEWNVWREWKHLDLVAESASGRDRFVVENKLYSVPYPAQLANYRSKPLPWAKNPGRTGDSETSYYLLSLMAPAFELPSPWRWVPYEHLLRALGRLDPTHFGEDATLVERYRVLVRRLVELKDAVDPQQDVEGPFAVKEAFGILPSKYFLGPIQRMRFSGLAQLISNEFGEQLPLVVDISKAEGSITYTRRLSDDRAVGWQFQGGQLRLFVLVQDAGLAGKGDRLAAARAAIADAEYVSLADFSSVATVLGERLGPLVQGPGEWRRFAPDFVYRYCKVDPTTSSAQLAEALSELTLHVKTWGTLD